jgi:predicted phosphodiesterase
MTYNTNLFKRAAIFTDIHFGAKSNSEVHNNDCKNFVDWFIKVAKENNCETCFFLGDWNHHRATINVQTLQYGIRALKKLNDSFDAVYFIAGNHDLFYRDRRDVSSVEWAQHLPNVTVIDDFFMGGDVVISPWLVQDEYKKLQKMGSKYLFSHLELPRFYMNGMVEMPDHGGLNSSQLNNFETVFSGHFHKRQAKDNIWYIGNAFPHNYGDVDDNERGMMILEWGGVPQFYTWEDQPTFKVAKLSSIVDNPDYYLKPNCHLRVNLDLDLTYEDCSFLKEEFTSKYNIRELVLIPKSAASEEIMNIEGNLTFASVDQVVTESIHNIESNTYSKALLLEIYNNL